MAFYFPATRIDSRIRLALWGQEMYRWMVAAGVAAFPCLACCLVAHLRTACVYGFMILGSMRTPYWLFARTRVDDAVYPIRREWSEDEYPLRVIFRRHVPVNPRSPTRSRKVASKSGRRLDCRVHELVLAVLRGLGSRSLEMVVPTTLDAQTSS